MGRRPSTEGSTWSAEVCPQGTRALFALIIPRSRAVCRVNHPGGWSSCPAIAVDLCSALGRSTTRRSQISDVAVRCRAGRYCAGMQAAVQTRYGPPDVVRIAEVDKPTIGDNEVLVQVHATTVNRTDCACRAANPFFMRLFTGLIRPRATVLGNEYAGVVEAVGSGVTAFSVGEQGVRIQRGPVRCPCPVPGDSGGRFDRRRCRRT